MMVQWPSQRPDLNLTDKLPLHLDSQAETDICKLDWRII